MAEFFEVPVRREDGSEGLHHVNIEAIAYVDLDVEPGKAGSPGVRIYLNNGYWFTVSGPNAEDVLSLIKSRTCVWFKERPGHGEPGRQ